MAAPKETVWDLDPHTAAKHELLRRYLSAWFPILGTYHGRIVYIDGFAGPGRYSKGEPGSPLIALEVASKQRTATAGEIVFWFVEERADRLTHLRQELAKILIPAHFKVTADFGRFDEKFGSVLESMEVGGQHIAPTFAFIDPFGFSGIPFALIERLLRQSRCEAFITFMVDAINRFLEHPEDKVVQHIVEAFGGDDAVGIAKGAGDRVSKLRDLYQSKLATAAQYVRFFEMRDRNDRPQYYLFFATNSALGHLKMKEAMWKVDPGGEFRFSDATNPGQLVLFEADPTHSLAAEIRNQFGGKRAVIGREVRTFVEDRTAYLKKHMTAALKREEEGGHIVVDGVKADGKKRRANTFPDEARLTWA
jgi:three-Cys-motif partner protein